MLEEVHVIVWVEERLDSISTVDCSNGNVLCGIRKKLWTAVFFTSKSILISEASTNGIQTKVSRMLEEVHVIVWVEERLDSISTVDGSVWKNLISSECEDMNLKSQFVVKLHQRRFHQHFGGENLKFRVNLIPRFRRVLHSFSDFILQLFCSTLKIYFLFLCNHVVLLSVIGYQVILGICSKYNWFHAILIHTETFGRQLCAYCRLYALCKRTNFVQLQIVSTWLKINTYNW